MTDLTPVITRLDMIISKLDEVITKITGGASTDNSDIIAGQNQNTQDIINNQNQGNQAIQDNADKNTGTIVEKIEETKNGIISGIVDGIKGLFLPSDDFLKKWFDDLYGFFNERLGFLMLPIDLLVKFIDIFSGMGASFSGIPFPEFRWIDGTVIIPAQSVSFSFLDTSWGRDLQQKIYFVGNVIMIGALIALMHRKLEGVLRN